MCVPFLLARPAAGNLARAVRLDQLYHFSGYAAPW
jgi:hypothetical protein